MHKYAVYGLSIGMIATAHSQTLNLRGKVTDGASKAVPNATVELLRTKQKTTTGADGMYSLVGTVVALGPAVGAFTGNMSFSQGVLELILAQAAPIRIELVDAKGNLLDRISRDGSAPGSYRFSMADRVQSDYLVIVKASIGSETKAFPYFRMSGGAGGAMASGGFSTPAAARLAKVSATVDTLLITATGFAAKKMEIAAYDATVDVALTAATDSWGGLKNHPMKSSGCGKPALKGGTMSISSAGMARQYILSIPANYDANKPSRLIFAPHGMGGSMTNTAINQSFYWLQPKDTEKTTVFVAPQGEASGTWRGGDDKDWTYFQDMHKYLLGNLCIDSSRVFVTGFSFGGMMTYALSVSQQKIFRAGIGLAPANYNIYLPKEADKTHAPIAWMSTTGMRDGSCPWVSNEAQKRGAKFIALEHAKDNGCTLPSDIPTWKSGAHLCYDFQGCKPGYPVKACTFNGAHSNSNIDPGTSKNWIPDESWSFIEQF